MTNGRSTGELTQRPPWRGAAFDRSQTAGVTTRKIVALPCVTLGGGSRKRLGVWLLGKFRILEATKTLQVVAASRNVRGSRPPRRADYWQSLCFKHRFLTQDGQKRLPSRAGRWVSSPVNLPFVISSRLTPSTFCRSILRFGRTRFGLGH